MRYLIFLAVLLFACNSTKRITKQNDVLILVNEGQWKTNFKDLTFSNILLKFYGNDFGSCCLSKDASGSTNYEGINFDTVVFSIVSKLSDSFVNRYKYKGEIEGRKVMMNFALEFRNSYELDSLTGVYYKQYIADSLRIANRKY
jgi:hypothetical protein